MAKFEYRLSDDDSEDRVYVRVDDVVDISILRIEEGLFIEVYDKDHIDDLGALFVDVDSLPGNRRHS